VWGEWQIEFRPDDAAPNPDNAALDARNFDLSYTYAPNTLYVKAPYWFYLLATVLSFASQFLTLRRFSLRTLLIATTLLAVGLGLIVYLNRAPAVTPINIDDLGRYAMLPRGRRTLAEASLAQSIFYGPEISSPSSPPPRC